MFCPNCGKGIAGDEDFCPECGISLKRVVNNAEMPSSSSFLKQREEKSPFQALFQKIVKGINSGKDFFFSHKKISAFGLGAFALVGIAFFLFQTYYDFTKLSWDTSHGDYQVDYTEPTTLTLKVLAYGKNHTPISKIQFSANAGTLVNDGTKVLWKLPRQSGDYTIVATAPSGKKIQKKVNVVNLNQAESSSLAGVLSKDVNSKTVDSDQDGIPDLEEKKRKTNPNSKDSDQDGLSDYYEIFVSKTDPLQADSDQDGLLDGVELDLGFNPLQADSKQDGQKDSNRIVTYTIEDKKQKVKVDLMGKGNIARTTIDVFENTTFANREGVLSKIYNFNTLGTIQEANIKITYQPEELKKKGLQEDNLSLYYFDDVTKTLELVPTIIEKSTKQLSATVKHFAKYIIGDKTLVTPNQQSDIMFVIDNSVSMYTKSQILDAGYKGSTGALGNDASFKRIHLTNQMIDLFTGNYQFGVAKFSGNYNKLKGFSTDLKKLKQTVRGIQNALDDQTNGTNIIGALEKGIAEFDKNDNNHYLLLLTDGKNTSGSLALQKNRIIANAKQKKVKVCVIGLGSSIDTSALQTIAQETGCGFYSANDDKALDEIYAAVGADINYNYIDTNQDHKTDGMIQANSGFLVKRDGFSFSNFFSNKANNGHCFGMATFAMLYYKQALPLKLAALDNSKFYLSLMKKVDLSSRGYQLEGTYFAKHQNLYDFKIKTKGLYYLLDERPGDYRDRVENNIWRIKKEYYDEMAKLGVTFSLKEYQGSTDFKKYESALLKIDNDYFDKQVTRDEAQLINAIWRLYILQANSKTYSFASDPDDTWQRLEKSLANQTAVILEVNGNHAINAIKLIQDREDADKFKIEVYDNNYAGETRYIEVTRSKYNKVQLNYTAWVNEYNYQFRYDADHDGKAEDITLKLSEPIIQ